MANPGEPKINSDTLSPPFNNEEFSVPSYEAQVQDPFSLMREAARKRLYDNQPSEVKERLVEVLEVNTNVKKPADLNYFSNMETMKAYGDVPFVCVIARVLDLDSGIPNPDLVIDPQTGKYNNSTITKIRCHVGKFYAPTQDSKGARIATIEVGDLLSAEFLDKTNMTNGIIKKIYAKKGTASQTSSGPVPGTTSPSNPVGRPRQPSNTPNNPTPLQEIWTLLAICFAESGASVQGMADVAQSIYNRYSLSVSFARLFTNGYTPSLTSVIVARGQYEPTFKAPEKWAAITDLETAIEALQAWRGPTYDRRNAERGLKKAFDSLKNPNNQASARNFVGLRTDFLGGAPKSASFAVERSPIKDNNNFHVRNDNSKKGYIEQNLNNPSGPPSSITQYLVPNAQWPPQ